MRHGRPEERGAALLTVLLLIAVLSVIAADTLDRLSLSTRLTGTAVAMDQARAFGDAAERLAVIRIGPLVSAADRTVDTGWSGVPLPLPLPVGSATLTVTDGGDCFNLNSLATGGAGADPNAEPVLAANPTAIAQFAGLMGLLAISAGDARHVAESAADWIDSNTAAEPAGAEDAVYRGRTPGYLPANRPMVSATELRAVDGVTPAIWATLRPWVCALPESTPSAINPNTLTPQQAPLIAMLGPGQVDVARVRAALSARPPGGFASTNDFWQAAGVQSFSGDQQLALRSRWFDARVAVTLDGTQRTSRALIDAPDGAGAHRAELVGVSAADLDVADAPLTVRRSAAERVAAVMPGDRIVIALPATSPVADFSLDWWRLDEQGAAAGGGRWPDPALEEALARPDAARRVLAIAPAPAVTLHWLAMPDLSARQARVAAQIKVADEAAARPDELHVVAGEHRGGDGAIAVAVVDRAVMADWLDWCARHRIDPDVIVPAPLLLAQPAGGTVSRADLAGATVLRGEDAGWQSDPTVDALLIGDDTVVDVDPAELDQAIAAAFAQPPLDLRVGPFAKRRRGVDRALVVRVLSILVACGVLELLIALVTIGRLSMAADSLDAEALALARPALSRSGAASVPADRLVATLDDELARRGGGPNSFTVPLAGLYQALSATPSAVVGDLSFTADGTLTTTLSAATRDELNQVLIPLQRNGFFVSYDNARTANGRETVSLSVRGSRR